MKLEILDIPDYCIAHPEDTTDSLDLCKFCLLVIRPDTGEIVLLWKCGKTNWAVSRNMPQYKRHRRELYHSLGEFDG